MSCTSWEPVRRLRHLSRVSGHLLALDRKDGFLRLVVSTAGSDSAAPAVVYVSEQLACCTCPTFDEIDWSQVALEQRSATAEPSSNRFRLVLLHQATADPSGAWPRGTRLHPDGASTRTDVPVEWTPQFDAERAAAAPAARDQTSGAWPPSAGSAAVSRSAIHASAAGAVENGDSGVAKHKDAGDEPQEGSARAAANGAARVTDVRGSADCAPTVAAVNGKKPRGSGHSALGERRKSGPSMCATESRRGKLRHAGAKDVGAVTAVSGQDALSAQRSGPAASAAASRPGPGDGATAIAAAMDSPGREPVGGTRASSADEAASAHGEHPPTLPAGAPNRSSDAGPQSQAQASRGPLVVGWTARPCNGDTVVLDRAIDLREDTTVLARDAATVLVGCPDLSAVPPGSLFLEVACCDATAARREQDAAASVVTSETVERLLREWQRLHAEGREAAAEACKAFAGRLQKRFHYLHPSRRPAAALFVTPRVPDSVLVQLAEDNLMREEKRVSEAKGQPLSVLSLVKGWFLPTRAAQAVAAVDRDAGSQPAPIPRNASWTSMAPKAVVTSRTVGAKGVEGSASRPSTSGSASPRPPLTHTPPPALRSRLALANRPASPGGDYLAARLGAPPKPCSMDAKTYLDINLMQQLCPAVQAVLQQRALLAELRHRADDLTARLAARQEKLVQLRRLQMRTAAMRHRNALLEKTLVSQYRAATQLERLHKEFAASCARSEARLARGGEALRRVHHACSRQLGVWQSTHRALVGRQCHLCAEIGEAFRITPKVVTVYQGGVLAQMEVGWMRGSAGGGGDSSRALEAAAMVAAGRPSDGSVPQLSPSQSQLALSDSGQQRALFPRLPRRFARGRDGLSVTQQPVVSILDLQMTVDLAGKAIRGELGWENTSLFNADHINAQLFYTALVVDMLSAILDVPLRYHIKLYGSHTTVMDPAPPRTALPLDTSPAKTLSDSIGVSTTSEREFPLFLTDGKTHGNVKLATATFWLAKDVELLMEAYDLNSSGTRETLANLYKLITAARTATQ